VEAGGTPQRDAGNTLRDYYELSLLRFDTQVGQDMRDSL